MEAVIPGEKCAAAVDVWTASPVIREDVGIDLGREPGPAQPPQISSEDGKWSGGSG